MKEDVISQITLKNISGNYISYTVQEAKCLYYKYSSEYINLQVFALDNMLSLESAEVLIRTVRTDLKKSNNQQKG